MFIDHKKYPDAFCEPDDHLLPTFIKSHVDGPVVLQTLQLLFHAPLAAAVIQRANQQHLQGSLAFLVVVQHGFLLFAHKALAHHPVPRAAVRVLVAHFARLDAVHPLGLSFQLRAGVWSSRGPGGQRWGQSWGAIRGIRLLIWMGKRRNILNWNPILSEQRQVILHLTCIHLQHNMFGDLWPIDTAQKYFCKHTFFQLIPILWCICFRMGFVYSYLVV